jgi:hypothetical protein
VPRVYEIPHTLVLDSDSGKVIADIPGYKNIRNGAVLVVASV